MPNEDAAHYTVENRCPKCGNEFHYSDGPCPYCALQDTETGAHNISTTGDSYVRTEPI